MLVPGHVSTNIRAGLIRFMLDMNCSSYPTTQCTSMEAATCLGGEDDAAYGWNQFPLPSAVFSLVGTAAQPFDDDDEEKEPGQHPVLATEGSTMLLLRAQHPRVVGSDDRSSSGDGATVAGPEEARGVFSNDSGMLFNSSDSNTTRLLALLTMAI